MPVSDSFDRRYGSANGVEFMQALCLRESPLFLGVAHTHSVAGLLVDTYWKWPRWSGSGLVLGSCFTPAEGWFDAIKGPDIDVPGKTCSCFMCAAGWLTAG